MALEFITNLIGTSPKVWTTSTAKADSQIKARMAAANEVRIFVDNSLNFGHQSSSVFLMKRLVDYFGFHGEGKTATMAYPTVKADKTLNKLALLLPGLNPNNPQDINYNGVTVRFMTVEALLSNAEIAQVNYGFTGGADAVDGRDTPNWFAIHLKVNLFLQLQPYQWQGAQLVQNGGDKSKTPAYDLTTITALGLGFNYRAWYTPDAYWTPTEGNWEYYTTSEDISENSRYHTLLIQALIQFMDVHADDLRLMPVYGIKTPPNQMGMQPENILPTVISTALGGSFLDRAKVPVVVVSMNNDLTDSQYAYSLSVCRGERTSDEQLAQGQYEKAVVGEKNARAALDNAAVDANRAELQQNLDTATGDTANSQRTNDMQTVGWNLRRLWLNTRNANDGVSFLSSVKRNGVDPVTVDGLNIALANLINQQKTARPAVLFLELGSLPPLIFNYLMSRANYPNVFEGANSNNLVLNQGGCYLRMKNNNAQPDEANVRYPQCWYSTRYNSYTKSVMESLAAADGVTSALNQTFNSAADFVPNITLTTDYVNNFYFSDNASLRTYYEQNHTYYHDPNNDRFMLGLSYLNQIAINQTIPINET